MKTKHNKKRNTAFLFESLVRELTKAIVSSRHSRARQIKAVIREHFHKGSTLSLELDCFRSLTETDELDVYTAEKMIFHAKKQHENLDQQQIFREQSRLIKDINSQFSSDVYNNFTPNYRSFATIAQVFNKRTPIKQRVLMEKQILHTMTSVSATAEPMEPVDGLVLKSFATNYNKKYAHLLPEQKELLGYYMTLNEGRRPDFAIYLLAELKRLDGLVTESLRLPEIKEDDLMSESTIKVRDKLRALKIPSVTQSDILTVLKVQKLVREYTNDN